MQPLLELKANPNIRILIISDVFDKSTERARVLREHMESNEAYQSLRPHLQITRKMGDSEFTVARGRILKEPTVRSTYAGGPISGGRYDLVIADDLVNWRLNSTTPEKRKKLRRWWSDEVMNSIASGGRLWVIGTRQHHDDLYEDIRKDARFTCVTYPALDEEDELGYREKNEGRGVSAADAFCLWPQAHPFDELAAKRAADEQSFMRQQQQIAIPESGLVYRRPLVDAALERGKGVVPDKGAAQFVAVDPGYAQRAAMLCIQEKAGDRIELWAEQSFTHKDDDDVASSVADHCAEWGVQTVYVDAEDAGLRAAISRELRKRGAATRVQKVEFGKYKRLAVKATRWLLASGRVAWRAETAVVHLPGRTTTEPSIFRAEVRDYALKEGSDDEPLKGDDHGPDAWSAYAVRWINAWLRATGERAA